MLLANAAVSFLLLADSNVKDDSRELLMASLDRSSLGRPSDDVASKPSTGREAERDPYPTTLTLGFNLGGLFTQTDSTTTGDFRLSGDIGLGKFVSESTELSFNLGGSAQSANDGDVTTGSVNYLGVIKFHLAPHSAVDPYLGLQAGFTTSFFPETVTHEDGSFETRTSSDTNVSAGGMIGVNIFVQEQTSFFLEVNYLGTAIDDGVTQHDVAFRGGLTFWF